MKAKTINEVLNFERGEDPRRTLGLASEPLFWECVEHLEEIEEQLNSISLHANENLLTIHATSYWDREEDDFREPFKLEAEAIFYFQTMKVETSCEMENEEVFYHPGSTWSSPRRPLPKCGHRRSGRARLRRH